ncbi:trypsin-like peptidase domain-containing protein [Salisaeta longa]|uniref:trypsin-like peptidase domain-containing protein n=1 Tax=Salisaeta longa TaxID=503170 RepID=UPI0003B7558B|nr:trypsin-like peptidase domain-containing protein [Salisaeta longa]
MSAKSKVSIAIVVVTAFTAGIFFATIGANYFNAKEAVGTATTAAPSAAALPVSPQMAAMQEAFTQVAETVNPAVVQIQAEKVIQRRSPFAGTPFEEFFGGRGGGTYRSQGIGSGVVVRSSGYIVTNNHVVENADNLSVRMFDGTTYDAEIVGTDPLSDLAVIKVDATELPTVPYADVESVETGQWVVAFGSPLSAQLSNTVTAGIVSAVGRLRAASQDGGVQNFIQTDAAINPGNSGGPLVNLKGQIIGINTAIISETGGYQGIGFAIPVNTVKRVAEQLIADGTVQRARLGIRYGPAPQTLIENEDLPAGAAVIGQVNEGSAADEAGLKAGDIIVSIDGQTLEDYLQVGNVILGKQPGDTVQLTVQRNGERQTFTVTLGAMNPGPTASNGSSGEGDEDSLTSEDIMSELGFAYRDITPEIARQLGLETSEGVIITEVDQSNRMVRNSGIQPRMVIVQMAGQRVTGADSFEAIYQQIEPGQSFRIMLQSPNGFMYVSSLTKPAN